MSAFTFPILRVVKVIDGDSLRLVVDLGFHIRRQVDVRLIGLDTPEPRGYTRAEGEYAGKQVAAWMRRHTETRAFLISNRLDKYGRVLGEIHPGYDSAFHADLNWWLLNEVKFARPYDGGVRAEWTEAQLRPLREAMAKENGAPLP